MKKTKPPESGMKKSTAAVILSLISAAGLILTGVGIWCLRHYLADPELIREYMGDHYVIGAIILVLICAIQVIIALIPGELVEIASGYAFGVWGGALLCWAGIMLGSVITLLLVRKLGRPFAEAFQSAKKLESISLLRDRKRRNALTLILFLIPGSPKDLWTYIIGLTDIKITSYVLLTGLARFPSIIMSTAGGDAMGVGQFRLAFWIMLVTSVVSIGGYLIYLTIQHRNKLKVEKEKRNNGQNAGQ